MANLVAPVNILTPIEERIIEFQGLNRKTVINDGEMSDMLNLTADNYPLLTPRKARGSLELPVAVKRPIHVLKRYGKIGYIAIDTDDNVSFFFDGQKIAAVTGLTTSSYAVAINTKMCFFPQKTYIEIVRSGANVTVGNAMHSLEASTGDSPIVMAVTMSTDETTVTLSSNPGFANDDAVNVTGTLTYTLNGVSTSSECNVSCVIENVNEGENSTVLTLPANSLLEINGATSISLTGTISRTLPELDFVMEWNNRLWGCCNADNTIYACKLGDPTNWQYFQGTSLDSYYAQQGTDEVFTGIAEYSGHIIFFKPNSMCRVYGTAPSNYQVTNTNCYGVEDGSSKSVLTINDTVFYKSSIGIMAYDGGTPYCISEKFNRKFKNVVAGTEGRKYYASCIVADEENTTYEGQLMVLDIDKAMWHKEDSLRFTDTCTMDNKLYYATTSADILYCDSDVMCAKDLMCGSDLVAGEIGVINPDDPTEDADDMDWMAIFGPFDEYIEEHKIYSKLAFRIIAKGECSITVYISIDEGDWIQVDQREVSTKGDFIPIVPRRCDRYSVKVVGTGKCEIKSLTRRVRKGSFGRI